MTPTVPFENAVDLLDADHKAVKTMFIEYNALCEDAAPAAAKRDLAEKICRPLRVHRDGEAERRGALRSRKRSSIRRSAR